MERTGELPSAPLWLWPRLAALLLPSCCLSGPTSASPRRPWSSSSPSSSAWWSAASFPARWPRSPGSSLYDVFFLPPYGTLTVRAAAELDRPRRLRGRGAASWPRSSPTCSAAREEARRREAGRRPAFRALPGPDRRLHAPAIARPHRRHGAGRLRPALDGPAPARADARPCGSKTPNSRSRRGRPGDHGRGTGVAHLEPAARPDRSAWPGGDAPSRVAVALVASNRPVGLAGAPRGAVCAGRTVPCSERSPTRPPWRSNGHSSRTRRCGPVSSRRSTAGAGP